MQFANRIKIDRKTDHFVVHFSVSTGEAEGDQGTPVFTVVLPLTTGIDLSLELFQAMVSSIGELQGHMVDVQSRITKLNELVTGAQAKQSEPK